jgi:diaminohydroxyphosphoribosylaminopyrimidine deaminase/5-amino-6-(5-phosphoribosylamino)uracil reductase
MVGAVVAKDGRIIAEGHHQRLGGAHAEVVALRKAGRVALGATLYVTLEPCCHQGRTGPCTEVILKAGVRRVVVACRDPHHVVAGRGLRRLRTRGLRVELGLRGKQARMLNAPYFKHITSGLPWVTLKQAVSLDGRIAMGSGESQFITGPAARRLAMQLRLTNDGLLVGVNTVLADDPQLTARRGRLPAKGIVRAVLDSRLKTPVGARLLKSVQRSPVYVFCSEQAPRPRRRALEGLGAKVVAIPVAAGTGLDVRAALLHLGGRGVGRLLVEGGGQVAASLLAAGLVDEVVWHLAPRFLGSEARPAVGPLGLSRLADAGLLGQVESRSWGWDLIVTVRVVPALGRGWRKSSAAAAKGRALDENRGRARR